MVDVPSAHLQYVVQIIRPWVRGIILTMPPSKYAKALGMTRCESIETTIREAGRVARHSKERLPGRVMFGTIAVGENPRPGGQFKTWHRYIVEDLREFRATEGSTELAPLVFGVETALWSTAAAKNAGRWMGRPG